MESQNVLLDAAVHYAQMGLCVIPLRPKSKKPYFDEWTDKATKEIPLIERWWHQQPNSNVGIATGARSNVFVLDIDPKNGGDESFETLTYQHGRLPETWTQITGSGGRHFFFRYPTFTITNKAGIFPGIDIRGEGGQVVAPPSIHPDTGRRYMWDGMLEPWDEPLGEAPSWLLDLLAPKEKKEHITVPARIPKGVQHHTLVSLAGAMRRLGLTDTEMIPTLQYVNAHRCEQPGPTKNIDQIAHSMMRYQPHEKNLWSQAATLWKLTRHAEQQEQQFQERVQSIDAYALLKKDLASIQIVIDGCLHNGCTILAGPPKAGKSWLTLGMAISVATGGKFLSVRDVTSPGRVAYWGLEEHERRTRDRLIKLIPSEEPPDITLENIEFMYSLRPMFSGGLDDLREYISRCHPTLVIIDTLMAFVTGERSSRRDVFRDDYREIKALSDIAKEFNTAVVVVHHTNKVGGTGVGAVAGSHGVTAAADCIWTMQRQPQRRAVLDITGREVEDQSFLLELELRQPIGWFAVEQGDDVGMSAERQEILELIREEGCMKPMRIAQALRKNAVTVRRLLQNMTSQKLVIRQSDGTYRTVQNAVSNWQVDD